MKCNIIILLSLCCYTNCVHEMSSSKPVINNVTITESHKSCCGNVLSKITFHWPPGRLNPTLVSVDSVSMQPAQINKPILESNKGELFRKNEVMMSL